MLDSDGRGVRSLLDALGLTDAEAEELPRLPKACALWKVRGRSAFVSHIRADYEKMFSATDSKLTP